MKTKPESVTYEHVCQAIEELLNSNDRASVRNVIAKTGGSATKISDFIRRYSKEKATVKNGIVVSDAFIAAISEERNRIQRAIEEAKAEEIKGLNEVVNDLQKIIEKNEKDLDGFSESKRYNAYLEESNKVLESNLKSARDAADTSLAKLGAITEKYNSKMTEYKDFTKKIELLENQLEKLKDEASTWKARAEQSEKQFSALLSKINK